MITRRLGCFPGNHAMTLNVGAVGQLGCTNGSSRTWSPGMALYWLKRKSRADVTPWPGSGVPEQDCRVLKFCRVWAVLKMRLESTLLTTPLISGSVATPVLGVKPTRTRSRATTSRRPLLIRVCFIESPVRTAIGENRDRWRHKLAA